MDNESLPRLLNEDELSLAARIVMKNHGHKRVMFEGEDGTVYRGSGREALLECPHLQGLGATALMPTMQEGVDRAAKESA